MSIRKASNPEALIELAAKDFFDLASDLLERQERIRLLLTGGTLGINFLAAIGKLALPWSRIWMMFSDERFVGLDHPDRNERQAIEVWAELETHLVRFPEPSVGLASARELQDAKLRIELGEVADQSSVFDLCVLGMGPDAHVASLFPGHEESGDWVIAVSDSPKPPAQRLSLSYQALNRSERVWFMAAGEPKQWALTQSLNANSGLPAARVRGRETVWYLDSEITGEL